MAISGAGVVRIELIDRGDPAAVDFSQAVLTMDNSWYDLDLSAIVPADAAWVLLRVTLNHTATNRDLHFRKNGNVNAFAIPGVVVGVINMPTEGEVLVPCDAGRVVEYRANGPIASVGITVLGWIFGS